MLHRRFFVITSVCVLIALGGGGVFWATSKQPRFQPFVSTAAASDSPSPQTPNPVTVEVIHPQSGGIQRICVQPGTVEPFESADLFAKASGFLVEQPVDIGSRVNKGDILARISVPEYQKQVQRDLAKIQNAKAKVRQMEAHLAAAKAESKAMEASVLLSRVNVRAKTSYRQYREKQLTRFKELAKERALEAKIVEEQEDYYLSALEAENAAKEGISTAVERATAAKAKIEQAQADIDEAKAGVEVATAEWERSVVLLDYTVIKSPYTGVITKRSFHPGDFIKSAEQGGSSPLFAIERTDIMRVVVRVPDRDVPYVHLGAPATIEIDALPGVVFSTKETKNIGVARWSDAEDPQNRTMRTEVDVPNPDGKLRHGMYGKVTLLLSEGTPNAVRVPSAALAGKAEGGKGMARILRADQVHVVPVRYASDNGVEAEIISGLSPQDQVVVRATGPIDEGTPVVIGSNQQSKNH